MIWERLENVFFFFFWTDDGYIVWHDGTNWLVENPWRRLSRTVCGSVDSAKKYAELHHAN